MVNVLFLALGVGLLLGGHLYAMRRTARREQRLAELRAGASEAWFEERRSLEAYSVIEKAWVWRVIGGLFVAMAVLSIFDLFKTRF